MTAPASLAAPKGAAPTLGKLLGVACRVAWELRPGGLEVLVHEDRAEYVLEPCSEVYQPRPPREVLQELMRSNPGVWAVSVLWWSPPRLEVLLLSVTGQNRVFRGEVIGE